MEKLAPLEKGTYIIAVSGGVDSVVLLDMLSRQPGVRLVVAHFDHGIRPGSKTDEQFVAALAERYQLEYVSERQELGPAASEATARQARYGFLNRTRHKQGATGVVTAHHADDVIETMVINLLRGTGWRGLCSLQSNQQLVRPLLRFSKAEILAYAKEHDIRWREDPTNRELTYLRNAVRHQLMPLLDRHVWLDLYENQKTLATEINQELARHQSYKRYDYIMWPSSVAQELVKQNLSLTRVQAKRALLAIKTAKAGTSLPVGGSKVLRLNRDNFIVEALGA